MPIDLELVTSVSCTNEYAESPCNAKVTIDSKLARHILHLSKVVRKEKVYNIEEFDYNPEFYTDEECTEKWEGTADCVCLKVMDTGFTWEGLIKHTSDTLSLESWPLSVLKEYLKVLKAKPTELILMVGRLKHEANQSVLESRLKGA